MLLFICIDQECLHYSTVCVTGHCYQPELFFTIVKCQTDERELLGYDDTLRYDKIGFDNTLEPRDSMDVVFVVEESTCNRDISRQLKGVIPKLEEMLRKYRT